MISRDLPAYSLDALREIARWQGFENVDQAPKATLVQRLSSHLTRPENVARSLDALLPHHRATLERVQLHGGSWATGALGIDLRRAGYLDAELESEGRSGLPDLVASRRLEDVLAHLAARGLVLTSAFQGYRSEGAELADPGRTAFIPSDVLPLLPPPRPIGPPEVVPRAASADLGTTRRDALLYWSYAERNDVQIIGRGTVAKRHYVRIAQSLLVPEDAETTQVEEALGRTHFLRLILQQAEILKVAGGRLQSGPRARAFFGLPDWNQSRTLYSAWLEGSVWNELSRLRETGDSYRVSSAPKELVGGRALIAQLVGELPPDEWVGLDQFLSGVRGDHYQFLIPRRGRPGHADNPYTSNSRNPLGGWFDYNVVPDESTGWEMIEAELVVQFLLALHWLGLIALGYDGDRLIAIQPTVAGRGLIRGEEVVAELQDKSLVVQANFQIIAYQHAPTSVFSALETFAERVLAGPAFEYRLTRETSYRARQAGLAAGQILSLLEAHSATPVPQNVRQSLLDWEKEQERIVFRPGASVLHALDPTRLDALLTAPGLAKSLGSRLAPDVLALRPGAPAEKLVQALARRGELLAVDRGDEPAPPSLDVMADGRIAFGDRLPSIYVRRALAAFAEEREGSYWMTTSSLRRGAVAGLRAEDVLATLRKFSRTPLPPEVERGILDGARHWGDVSLAAVALVRVESREILDQLLGEPSLRRLLRRIEGQECIAVARLEDIERLREALEALGVEPRTVLR